MEHSPDVPTIDRVAATRASARLQDPPSLRNRRTATVPTVTTERLPSVAYYYPEPFWRGDAAGWIKTLLVMFDSVAILLPGYMHGRHTETNPWLAEPLEDKGLLTVLRPETFIDQAMTESLIDLMVNLVTAGAFDELQKPKERWGYQELSHSRLGWNADVGLSEMLIEDLKSRGLAIDSEDGVSVPLHPVVRTTVLVLLAQLAQKCGRELGMDLQPTTADRARVADLIDVLSLPTMPTAGRIVGLDIETVCLNLEDAPLDDVLAFRSEHGASYRAYMRDVRSVVRELSGYDADQREDALADRREQLADLANELHRTARRSWRRPFAKFGVGAAGAAISVATASPVAAVLSMAGATLELERAEGPAGPFSFLFETQHALVR